MGTIVAYQCDRCEKRVEKNERAGIGDPLGWAHVDARKWSKTETDTYGAAAKEWVHLLFCEECVKAHLCPDESEWRRG